MTFEDPIVAEVRATRERLLAEAGGFDAFVLKLKRLETEGASRLVTKIPLHDEVPKAAICAESLVNAVQ